MALSAPEVFRDALNGILYVWLATLADQALQHSFSSLSSPSELPVRSILDFKESKAYTTNDNHYHFV